MSDTANSAPDEQRLLELYRLTAEELRFQIDLNWRRTQYFFALNAAVLAAGIGLLSAAKLVDDAVIAVLFGAGIVISLLASAANWTQHSYPRSVRDTRDRIRDELALGEFGLQNTPGSGSGRERFVRVNVVQQAMLVTLAVADAIGLLVTIL